MSDANSWQRPLVGGVLLALAALALGVDAVMVAALVANIAMVPLVAAGVRRHRPPLSAPWRMFQIGGAFSVVGNLLHTLGKPPFDRCADLVDVIAYGFLVGAMWAVGRARRYRRDPSNLVDALIAVGGLAVIEWIFVVVPYLRNPALDAMDRTVAVTFSILSMAALALTIRLAIGPGARSAAFYLLLAASVGAVGSDVVTSIGLASDGSRASWQLPVAALLAIVTFASIAAASWHPRMVQLAAPGDEPVPMMTIRRLAMMTIAVLIAPVSLLARAGASDPTTVPVVVACWLLVSVLVMVRLAGLVRARGRLAEHDRRLAKVAEALLAAADVEVPAIVVAAATAMTGSEGRPDAERPSLELWSSGAPAPVGDSERAVLALGRVAVRSGPGDVTGSRMLAPIVVSRELRGILSAPISADTDDETIRSLARLAREAALALERSMLIAETERQAGERRFRALVDHSSDAVLQLDEADVVRFATPATQRVFGWSDGDLVGRPLADLVEPGHREQLALLLAACRAGEEWAHAELLVLHRHDGAVWVELVAADVRSDPAVGSVVATVRAIEERKTAEQRMARSEARFRALVQHSSDVVAVVDGDFVISYASPSIGRVLGHDHDEMVDSELLLLVHPDDRTAMLDATEGLDPTGAVPTRLELRVRDGRDSWRTLELTMTDLRRHPAVAGIVINAHDISERKDLELDLARQAMFDDLTGLSNRARFRQKLSEALERRQRHSDVEVAVLFLDLNEFKTINDSMGHSVGDDLLMIVARRLAGLMGPHDVAARLGGDEFALLVVSDDRTTALDVAGRVHGTLANPISVGGRELTIGGSIGVAYADHRDAVMGDLLRNADTAMYVAKRRGPLGQIEVFDASMLASVTERMDLMNDLGPALERNELVLYYQPLIDLGTGRLKGFEALARWQHPTRGMLAPSSFVALAEETGLIVPLTRWVLDAALAQLAAWQDAGAAHGVTMSVNLSGRSLQAEGAATLVSEALRRHRIDPSALIVEVTESVAFDSESPDVVRRLLAITELGVRLAADDFGAGFASYATLQRLPYSVVKIDRSVIDGLELPHQERARLQIRSIIEMAHGGGMTVVAEGIEGAEQLAVLSDLGCDVGQGYYFSRPVPAEEAGAMLVVVVPAA